MRNPITFANQPPEDWAPRIILLNGPPRSGKDTIAQQLQRSFGGLGHDKFSKPLKRAVCALYGLDERSIEIVKDTPLERTYGYSYRQLQIEMSTWMKQMSGDDIMGVMAADRVRRNWKKYYRGVVFSDCGFQEEVDAFVERLPIERMCVIRMTRHGCAWDSRGPVDSTRIPCFDVANDGTVTDTLMTIRETIAAHQARQEDEIDEPDRRDD